MSGIRTRADLKARCTVDVDTGCWHWKGKLDQVGKPSIWFPPLQQRCTLGVIAAYFRTGERPKPGTAWHSKCSARDCANPGHRIEGNRSTQLLAAKLSHTPATRARISQRRARISDADVAQIRTAALPVAEIVERFGVCAGYAAELRNGTRRQIVGGGAPGSSVFAWRPGA
jgi:hypothetical protein